MTVLAFHTIATETLPELERFSLDETIDGLVVDDFNELVFLKNALFDIVKNQDDIPEIATPERVALAKELRDQILDDVTEMQIKSSDRLLPVTYEIEEPQLVIEAVKLRKQITQEKPKVHYPEYDWLSDPMATHEAGVVARTHTSAARKILNEL